ncbi:hypothetical protein KIPB_012807, partial [Kipferlia bialata]|eukprot:g12807.t1
MDSLVVVPISRAQAAQRAGRAGRTAPGKCYRLYTENAFHHEMPAAVTPEIQRTNLASVVLSLKAMGVEDILRFDFMDKPSAITLTAALKELFWLGALDDNGLLTQVGRHMAEFPLDPHLSKMLLSSCELGSAQECLSIIGMLTTRSVFYRPKDKQDKADQAKQRFHAPEGDHLTLLNVYEAWKAAGESPQWARDHFINARGLKDAKDVRGQLERLLSRRRLAITSCGRKRELVIKAIVAGFFHHVARKDPQEGYKVLQDGTQVDIHNSSAIYRASPRMVVFHDMRLTSREFMFNVSVIRPQWLVEMAPN